MVFVHFGFREAAGNRPRIGVQMVEIRRSPFPVGKCSLSCCGIRAECLLLVDRASLTPERRKIGQARNWMSKVEKRSAGGLVFSEQTTVLGSNT
jgi:hypothetical protein